MARPKIYPIILSELDVLKLKTVIRNKKSFKTIIRRCQILLELDENNPKKLTQMQLANTFGMCKSTISNIVLDYSRNGLDAAITYHRNLNSNAKSKADDRSEAHIIELACSAPPEGHARWTLRLLVEKGL